MRSLVTALCLVSLFLIVMSANAEIPKMISYQGRITDSGGTPVPDGSYDMRFRIFDAATGGTVQWNSGVFSVDISGGVFNVLLGESPQPAVDLDFDENITSRYWLQYQRQCWGVRLIAEDEDNETSVMLEFQLKGLGALGLD